jgi:hypothetical protein
MNTGLRLLYKQLYYKSIAAGQRSLEQLTMDTSGDPHEWYRDEHGEQALIRQPLLFDFVRTFELRANKLSVKIANSTWYSKGISLETEGTSGSLCFGGGGGLFSYVKVRR